MYEIFQWHERAEGNSRDHGELEGREHKSAADRFPKSLQVCNRMNIEYLYQLRKSANINSFNCSYLHRYRVKISRDYRGNNEIAASGVNNTEATLSPSTETEDYNPHYHRNVPNPTSWVRIISYILYVVIHRIDLENVLHRRQRDFRVKIYIYLQELRDIGPLAEGELGHGNLSNAERILQ